MASSQGTIEENEHQGKGENTNANQRGSVVEIESGDLKRKEQRARQFAAQKAFQEMSELDTMDDIIVRDLLPHADFEIGDDNGWNGSDRQFIQSGLSANAVNETYKIDSKQKAESKVIVIYAIANRAATPRTSQIVFRDESGGAFEEMNVEGMLLDQEVTAAIQGYIWFSTTDDGTIEQWATSAGDDQLIFHGVVAEKEGETLKGRID